MVIVLFRSRLTEAAGEDYNAMAEEMVTLANGMPGFIDVKSFQANDGERLTVVRWENEETMRAWREHPRHQIAQRLGRERWYQTFDLEVVTVARATHFDRG
jgi:heme-degrading monooxygenase HmoA